MTYLATMLCGSDLFRGVKKLSIIGVSGFASTIGLLLGFSLRYFFLADKFVHFKDCISIGDISGKLYGKQAKIYTGVVAFLSTIVWYGMQVHILASTFHSFLNIDLVKASYYSAIIISLYTSMGGMKSVVSTDILQFFLL